jgi:hypothetical protein
MLEINDSVSGLNQKMSETTNRLTNCLNSHVQAQTAAKTWLATFGHWFKTICGRISGTCNVQPVFRRTKPLANNLKSGFYSFLAAIQHCFKSHLSDRYDLSNWMSE